jgi:DNA-binding transcriptional ArsR family regulator
VGSEVAKEESRRVPPPPPSPPRAPSPPDYEFSRDILEVRDPKQFKAVGDPTRSRIISLLTEKAATTSQLAEALGQPKGSIGHHLKVLEKAGLIRVVRTRQVRAITEKYYGRTARLFDFREIEDVPGVEPFFLMRLAMREAVNEYVTPEPVAGFEDITTLGHARIPADKAQEFADRVKELAEEFRSLEQVPGERVYGFIGGVYLTDLPEIPAEEEEG